MPNNPVKYQLQRANIFRGGRLFKSKRGVLSSAAIIAGGGLGIVPSGPAYADECGAYTIADETIICTTATYTAPDAITYTNVDGLTLVLDDPDLDLDSTSSPVSVTSGATATNDITINANSFGTISSPGRNAWAIVARHAGSEGNAAVTLGSGNIETAGFQGHGAYAWIANSGSLGTTSVTMNGGSIATTENRGRGLYSRNQGLGDAIATMNGGSINTSENQGHGVIANVDNFTSTATSRAVINDGSVTTRFERVRGLYALSRGLGDASAIMNDGEVETLGFNAFGVNSLVTNSDATGLASISFNGGRVSTNGDFAYALFSRNDGSGEAVIDMTGGSVETLGDTAAGALAFGETTRVTVSGGDISVAGTGVWSIAQSGPSGVILSGGSVTSGTFADNSFPTAAIWTNSQVLNTINISTGVRVDGSGSGLAIREGDRNLDGIDEDASIAVVTTAGDVTGDAVLGLGNDVFNLAGGSFDGDIYGDDASASGLEFADFVMLYDGIFSEEQLRGVDPVDGVGQDDTFNWTGGTFGSTFPGGNGSDVANITAPTYDGTYHVLDGGDDYETADGWIDVLTLSGDVSGDINGVNVLNWERVNLDAVQVSIADGGLQVGADPASGLFLSNGTILDQSGVGLTLTGNMHNAATLSVQNGSVGEVITVDGDYNGAGGRLLFDTVMGTDGSPTDRMNVGGDLTGTSRVSITNVGGTGAPTTSEGIKLVDVAGQSSGELVLDGGALDVGAFRYGLFKGGVADPNDQDWYLRSQTRDIVPPAIFVARIADSVGMAFLGTLHERVGEQEHIALQDKSDEGFRGFWGRIIGRGGHENASSALYGDSRTTSQLGGIQMGLDLYRDVSDDGSSTTFGFYGGYAEAGSSTSLRELDSLRFAGRTRSDGWLGGLYATHRADSGWYGDAVVQGSWLDNQATARDGSQLDSESRTIVAALELGKPFTLSEHQRDEVLEQRDDAAITFEPQVQIIYANRSVDEAVDSTGIANFYDLRDSWTGRAGFRLTRAKADDYRTDKGLFTGYLKANYWNTFSGGDIALKVGVSDFGTHTPYKEWIDMGMGATLTMAENAEFFFDADLEFGIDQHAFHANGRGGIRFNW